MFVLRTLNKIGLYVALGPPYASTLSCRLCHQGRTAYPGMLLCPQDGAGHLPWGALIDKVPTSIRDFSWQGIFHLLHPFLSHGADPTGIHQELKLLGSTTGQVSLFYLTNYSSINVTNAVAYRNRQEVIEAMALAATGKVTCHYTIRKLEEIERYARTISYRERLCVCSQYM